jgi:Trk K+ transport system NAD-binding subunit
MGEVGQAAHSIVSEARIDTVTIDIDDHEGVDIVADTGSKQILQKAGIENSGAIIVGLPDDSASLLTTVLARSLDPSIEILTRVSNTDATEKALRAGADYVLSVPRVSARMIAKELRDEDILAPASQIRFVRVSTSSFAGSTLAESGIYEKTGCRIIAIEHKSGLSSNPDPHRTFTGDEQMTVVGSDEAVQRFLKQFDVSRTEIAEESELSSERAPD